MPKYKKREDGRYEAKITIGRSPEGKLIRKSIYAKSIREMDQAIIEAKITLQSGHLVKNSDTLFYDYALSWLETYKASKSINTIAMYQNIIEKHVKNEIGHLHICDIQKSDIQKMINERHNHPSICEKIILTLRQIFDSAIEDNMILKSPLKGIELPKKTVSRKRPLTPLEKQAIKKANLEPMKRAFINILFYTGMRREEALALTKTDFNWNDRTVSVNKAIVFDKNTPVLSDTKNSSSIRIIPIPSDGFKQLKDYVTHLSTLYLFTKQDGTLITHSAYVKFWSSILKELNHAIMTENQWTMVESMPKKIRAINRPINDLTAHIFRHNYATMLYYSDISLKKAAALMGHSNTNMIMQVYSHLDEEKEKTSEKLDANIRIS